MDLFLSLSLDYFQEHFPDSERLNLVIHAQSANVASTEREPVKRLFDELFTNNIHHAVSRLCCRDLVFMFFAMFC